jgi:hypothetical protein
MLKYKTTGRTRRAHREYTKCIYHFSLETLKDILKDQGRDGRILTTKKFMRVSTISYAPAVGCCERELYQQFPIKKLRFCWLDEQLSASENDYCIIYYSLKEKTQATDFQHFSHSTADIRNEWI